MARYDYQCPNCGTRFEVEHPMSARPKVTCPRCGQEAKHVFETSGIVFKARASTTPTNAGSSAVHIRVREASPRTRPLSWKRGME